LHTCYAPLRYSHIPLLRYLPFSLHVLGLPLAFILSQDQTLHCKSFSQSLKASSDSRSRPGSYPPNITVHGAGNIFCIVTSSLLSSSTGQENKATASASFPTEDSLKNPPRLPECQMAVDGVRDQLTVCSENLSTPLLHSPRLSAFSPGPTVV